MSQKNKSNAIETIITKALLQLGFSPANNGFYYLRDAVKLAYFDSEDITLITKLIYAPIAKEYNTSGDNIEKSIRKASESVWAKNSNQSIAVLNNIYYFPEQRPENKELISLICGFIKQAVNIFDADISKGI